MRVLVYPCGMSNRNSKGNSHSHSNGNSNRDRNDETRVLLP